MQEVSLAQLVGWEMWSCTQPHRLKSFLIFNLCAYFLLSENHLVPLGWSHFFKFYHAHAMIQIMGNLLFPIMLTGYAMFVANALTLS